MITKLNLTGFSLILRQQMFSLRNTGVFAKTMELALAEIPIESQFVNLRA